MRTTLDLQATLLDEAMKIYQFKSKTETIEYALKEIIGSYKRKQLASLFGTESNIKPIKRRVP